MLVYDSVSGKNLSFELNTGPYGYVFNDRPDYQITEHSAVYLSAISAETIEDSEFLLKIQRRVRNGVVINHGYMFNSHPMYLVYGDMVYSGDTIRLTRKELSIRLVFKDLAFQFAVEQKVPIWRIMPQDTDFWRFQYSYSEKKFIKKDSWDTLFKAWKKCMEDIKKSGGF